MTGAYGAAHPLPGAVTPDLWLSKPRQTPVAVIRNSHAKERNMKVPFYNRFNSAVICEIEISDDVPENARVKIALEKAVGRKINLSCVDLKSADLEKSYLYGAILHGADLNDARLSGAELGEADLSNSRIVRANLRHAVLASANLRNASLKHANLSSANLSGANLQGADLRGAYLRGAKLPAYALCPEEGAFIGWKKLSGGLVAKLEIPARAKRVCSLVGRKMRAEYVKTLAIFAYGGEPVKSGMSMNDITKYQVGKITRPDKFDDDPRVECTHGIHFFITRKEAEDY